MDALAEGGTPLWHVLAEQKPWASCWGGNLPVPPQVEARLGLHRL